MENQVNLAGSERASTHKSRLSKERMENAVKQLNEISESDYEKVMGLVNVCKPFRSIIHKTPDDYGMTDWKDVFLKGIDGVPLDGWYIPAKGGESNKLVIFNHALPMCRSGFQGHLGEPFSGYDNVEIDFVIQMKHLTDAGYNVLAYDIRNHGRSGSSNNGVSGIGQLEWRDCAGVKQYVDNHPRLSKMKVALYSQCMGGNSQYEAISRHPELFENVKCMVSPMVVSMRAIYEAFSSLQGVSQYLDLVDFELLKAGGWLMDEMTPHTAAPDVKMPVFMIQVKDDAWTKNPEDGQKTFDLLGSEEKEIHWIENTDKRFKDGYNYFGRHPEKVLAFLDKYMK
ncbi:alpha/beta hydrolase family protein [Galbibacter pacificus]|uniref:Alpha/beta hydrolase n=1 Tax=Galbibacter pacificus TaxID=2996052 RepID=A0ABT6FU07_9FLAO|nr:alpha/beta hydrolase [Galbibacter pacificus]MDG3583275.1 alpha/beta hydrolase [Galbibacter pacificus]MDG3586756.1 alpha/beta hydrolase [Galbibacter pacificus]